MKKIFAILFLTCLTLSGCTPSDNKDALSDSRNQEDKTSKVEISYTAQTLPITDRNFLIGTAGYTPPYFPASTPSQITDYWYQVNQSGEIYGVHVAWNDTKILELVNKSFDGDIVLVIGVQEPELWVDPEKESVKQKVLGLLSEYPKIKYVAIGNEINDLRVKYPSQFDQFISMYKEIYSEVKNKYPEIYLFTTFQYEWLKGEGYLTGKAPTLAPQWDILDQFGDHMDLVGLTIYPYFDYKSPDAIPDDYLEQITLYTDKPIAITETGWITRGIFSGSVTALNQTGYEGSEDEQVEYLNRLVKLGNNSNLIFIDWLFLNDPYDWENIENSSSLQLFDSAGLKNHDGTEKKAWDYWLTLKDLEYRPD